MDWFYLVKDKVHKLLWDNWTLVKVVSFGRTFEKGKLGMLSNLLGSGVVDSKHLAVSM